MTSTLADFGLARQQLGDADSLDRLAQTHVVGQNGPAGADCESDAVELIRQERDLDESLQQRMLRGVLADFGDEAADAAPRTAAAG